MKAPKIKIKIKSVITEHLGRVEIVYTSAYKIGNQLFWRWLVTKSWGESSRTKYPHTDMAEKAALEAAKRVVEKRQLKKEKSTEVIEYEYVKVT